jgi:hypothetical protein|tara:strand:+ start:712 stop:915 length:204 start_codon:yes stop_codon:yes gene_type:complete
VASLTKIGVKVFGPFSPKEFSDLGTLQTAIQADIQAISDSSSTSSVIDTEVFPVLGNYFVMVTYQQA